MQARTLEVLEPLGVSSQLVSAGDPVPTFRIRERGHALATIDLSDLDTPFPFTLMQITRALTTREL